MKHGVTTAAALLHNPFSWPWWVGEAGRRPFIILGLLVFFSTVVYVIPAPQSMINLAAEKNAVGARYESGTDNYVDSYSRLMKSKFTAEKVACRMKVCVAMLFTIALLWGTEAIPLGATDILVGVILYLFFILPLNGIAKAYMKDAVFFIAGVLILAAGVSVTGLDRRIGYLLLGKIRGLKGFCFIFFPMLAFLASLMSEHALVAFLCPILLLVYMAGEKEGLNKKQLKALACTLFLGICFAANVGGSGSPAVGGRSAIMIGYFSDYGMPMSFSQWVMYGLPLVPIIAMSCGLYVYLTLARRTGPALNINIGKVMKKSTVGMGPPGGKQLVMAILFMLQIVLWVFFSAKIGLGGATFVVVLLMLLSCVITWKEIQARVRFDIVGLYAGACAMGVALKATGAGLWLAREFVGILPGFFHQGVGVVLATSFMTTIMTNFMSDGATVGALGPIVLPMAAVGGIHLWKVGLACSFASSYAHAMIVGTVNNAIAYGLARHPETGEPLISVFDFMKYGFPFVVISLLVCCFACFLGYWQLLPWPPP